MRKNLLILFCMLFSVCFKATAVDIYTYTATSPGSGIPSFIDPLLASATDMTPYGTGTTTPCTWGFSGMSGFNYATYSTTNPSIQIKLVATAGNVINVTNITSVIRRSGTGPSLCRYAYSFDSLTWIDQGSDYTVTSTGCLTSGTAGTITPNSWNLCITGSTVYIRLYPYAASGPGGAFQIYSLSIAGSIVPSSMATAATATAGGPTTFCSGGSVVLSATTGAGYTYQWYNGTTAIAGAVSSTYTATTSGDYYAIVNGPIICTDTTNTITVTVPPTPVVTTLPAGSLNLCLGTPIDVIGSSTVAAASYQWYNGATPIPGATDNTYSITAGGTYSLSVTSAAGCEGISAGIIVSAFIPPIANITPAGATNLCPGYTQTFSNTVTLGTYTYQWFDASGPIAGAVASTYNTGTAGSYSLVVTGSGGCTDTSNTVTVSILPAPDAAIVAGGVTTFCSGGSVTLSNTGMVVTGDTYQWDRGTTPIAGATNSTYVATTSGNYRLRILNTSGCTDTSNVITVTALPLPTTTITPSGSIQICAGNSATLTTAAGAGIFTYQWYRDGSAITGATNSTYAASTAGTYTVNIVNTFTGCTAATPSTGAAVISVNPKPVVNISAGGPTTFCGGLNVVLTSTVTGAPAPYTYAWRNGTTPTGTTTASYTANTSGTYNIIAFTAFGCSDTSNNIVVNVVPAPVVTVSASGSLTFCDGNSVTLTSSTGTGYTYQWYDGTTPISGATNNTYTATTTGNYNIHVTNPTGCLTVSSNFAATAVPTPVITPVGPTEFCNGGLVVLTVSIPSSASGVTFQWKKDGVNLPGAITNTYTANTTGSYTCFVNVSGSCLVTTAAVNVVVNPAPLPVVFFSGTQVYTHNYYTGYQWYINTVLIPGATNYSYNVTLNGNYRVKVYDTNGCSNLSDGYAVNTLDVDDVNQTEEVSIFPNPANDMVYINSKQDVQIIIATIDGKSIINSREKQINITTLSNGIYLVHIYDNKGNKLKTDKLTKQ